MMVMLATAAGAQLPDLIMWGPAAQPYIVVESFSTNDCAVVEGCVTGGTRRLLRFASETRNIGAGNLVLGDPVGNPLFHYQPCHGHYHFEQFAAYRLKDTNGVVVATGLKAGFCLLDYRRWSGSANANSIYDCSNQGIQAGWADVYSADLDCQWIDVTDLPDGTYDLELEVNPARLLTEADYSNNIAVVPVVIAAAPVCTNVVPLVCGQVFNGSLSSLDCRSEGGGGNRYADRFAFAGEKGQRIVVTMSAVNIDSYLYLFGPNNAPLASDDDSGDGRDARLPGSGYYTLPVDGTYSVEATSFSASDAGSYTLQLTCPAIAPFVIQSVGLTNNQPIITWSSVPGESYQVEYNPVLSVLWLPLPGGNYIAQAGQNSLSHIDGTVGSATNRFYRVRLLQP